MVGPIFIKEEGIFTLDCCLPLLRLPSEQPPTTNAGPSPSRSIPTATTLAPSNQNSTARQSQPVAGGAKPSTLPANLDEFKVKLCSCFQCEITFENNLQTFLRLFRIGSLVQFTP